MRKFSLNWAVVLAIIVLLTFTYIAFLGWLYQFDGNILKAALWALGAFVLVAGCVYFMVNSKMTKEKELGLVGQILFGIVILVTFLFFGSPFTSFLKVVGSRQTLKTSIENIQISASEFDKKYNDYVALRLDDFRGSLQPGDDLKAQSLQWRLCPDSIADIQRQRQNWVAGVGEMSIWNIRLPQNLQYMKECIDKWTENYKELSSFAFDNESLQPFEYSAFNSSMDDLMNSIKHAGYSFWALFVAILSALVMMLPYWLAVPVQTRKATGITYE